MTKRKLFVITLVTVIAVFLGIGTGCSDANSGPTLDNNDGFPESDDDDQDGSRGDDNDFSADDAGGGDYTDDYIAPWPQTNILPQDYDETLPAGPLRQKAMAYDKWHMDFHQPYYGGTVETTFTDETRTEVSSYCCYNDSCEWTGMYLSSQAFRYHVTGDQAVRQNVIRIARSLSGNLHVTGTPGFIARYWAPLDPLVYPGDDWCDHPDTDRCHRVETGDYAGHFWWGETSRDMYNGWFMGLVLAYDLVDDEQMRETIKNDMTLVLDQLTANNWMIIDEAGEPSTMAPEVLPGFRVAWLTIGYHVTGEQRFKKELQKWLLDSRRNVFRLLNISFMNRYTQYYGNCLSHEMWLNLLRLGRVYFSRSDFEFLLNLFETQVHSFARLSHNPWFNGVFMGQGDYRPGASGDPYYEQLVGDLSDFREAPHYRYYLPERDPATYELDPLSIFFHDLMIQYPALIELMGLVRFQAETAFPIRQQCTSDFIFQRNPFQIEACGSDDPSHVYAGVDYLISYWLASYHGFISKDM